MVLVFIVLSIGMQGGGRYYFPSAVIMSIYISNMISINNINKYLVYFFVSAQVCVKLALFFDMESVYKAEWPIYSDSVLAATKNNGIVLLHPPSFSIDLMHQN